MSDATETEYLKHQSPVCLDERINVIHDTQLYIATNKISDFQGTRLVVNRPFLNLILSGIFYILVIYSQKK